MFIEHTNPHHIKHPIHGWLNKKFVSLHDRTSCECGHKLSELVGSNFEGGAVKPFESGEIYHLEIDCSTGLHGYTRVENG